jgi:hypothetical protein
MRLVANKRFFLIYFLMSSLVLPYGWEQRTDDKGRVYFVDHNSRTTTYNPPYQQPQHPFSLAPQNMQLPSPDVPIKYYHGPRSDAPRLPWIQLKIDSKIVLLSTHHISVTEAKDLKGGPKAKPYVKLEYMGLKFKTKHVKHTLNPKWQLPIFNIQ